jgi:mannose-6-phosphate isomerase-like protein (cupin superfamily)
MERVEIMSTFIPEFDSSVIIRAAEAELVGAVTLLADSNACGGALSTVRARLEKGLDGARPHRHDRSAEMFYMLDGALDILVGREIVRAQKGDMVVVPPRMPHAFSAPPDHSAELLIVITPGVERFGYFHQLLRITRGELPPESLRDVQELYDTWFLQSPEWEARLTRQS